MGQQGLSRFFDPVDHLGVRYRNVYKMLDHFRVTSETARCRYQNGWSLEKILTTPDDLFSTRKLEKKFTTYGYKYTSATAKQLNIQVKNIAQMELSALTRAKDPKLYFRQEHERRIPSSLNGAYFALTNLWIHQRVGNVVKKFPVFSQYNGMEKSFLSKSLILSPDFMEVYDDPQALIEIYLLLIKKGLCLRIKEGDFFLGFKDYSNLVFIKNNYRVKNN